MANDAIWSKREKAIFENSVQSSFSLCSHKAFIEGSNVGFGGDPDWFLVIRWFPPPENWVKLNSKCYKGSSW